jgi:hypothetical protein
MSVFERMTLNNCMFQEFYRNWITALFRVVLVMDECTYIHDAASPHFGRDLTKYLKATGQGA